MSDKLKNFFIRAISGVVMFAVVLGAILGSKWSFGALVMLITLGGEWEFYRLAKKAGTSPQCAVGLLAGALPQQDQPEEHLQQGDAGQERPVPRGQGLRWRRLRRWRGFFGWTPWWL